MSEAPTTAMICDECGHFFDPDDDRAFKGGPMCPCCAMLTLRGAEAWAVWNDCNGVFTDTVRNSRADAAAELDGGNHGTVVPIRCYPEPEEQHALRHWLEDDRVPDRRGTKAKRAGEGT